MEFVDISHLSYPLIGKWTHILEVKEYMLASFTGITCICCGSSFGFRFQVIVKKWSLVVSTWGLE